jgi:hypothetical protein
MGARRFATFGVRRPMFRVLQVACLLLVAITVALMSRNMFSRARREAQAALVPCVFGSGRGCDVDCSFVTGDVDRKLRRTLEQVELRDPESLRIRCNRELSGEAFKHLGRFHELRYLTLVDAADTLLVRLPDLPLLRQLDLRGGNVANESLARLHERMPNCKVVREKGD